MADAVGNIHVNLLVNTGSASRFTAAANVVGRDSTRMRTALDGTSRSISALRMQSSQGLRSRLLQDMVRQATVANNELGLLRSTMLGLAAVTGTSLTGAFAGTYLLQTADQAHLLSNQLRTVTTDSENLAAVQERLYRLSQQTRSGMDSTIKVYARTARATDHLGYSQENLVRITETIQKAFAVGGASAQEAMGAAIQLSQGIASDRFSGEEYRSVAENAPVLLRGMADAIGVNIGQLREMAHAGELTAEVVTQAILGAGNAIDADFAKMGVTVGQSLTRLHNAFLMYIGDVDTSRGVTAAMADGLSNLAENFEEVANWAGLALTAIGAVAGGRMIGGAAGSVFGNTVGQYAQIRKETTQQLEAMRAQETALRAQQATLRTNIAQQRDKLTAIVNQRHAINATSKDIQRSYALEKRELQRLTQLRMQAVGLAQSHATVINQVATAQARATRSASAMNALRGVGSGILGIMGGWTGVAFTAAVAGMIAIADSGMKAAARTERLKNELNDLGLISDEVAGRVDVAAQSLDELADDEIRNKIRTLREELHALRNEQGLLDRTFNYNPQNVGNIISDLDRQLQDFQAFYDPNNPNLRFEFTAEGGEATRSLRDLAVQARDSEIASDDLIARLDELAAANPEMGKWFDDAITNLRLVAPYLEGINTQVDRLSSELSQTGDANPLLRTIDAQRQYAEAMQRSAEAAEILNTIVNEEVRQAGLTEDQARLEQVMTDLRKEWEKVAEESGEQLRLNEENLKAEAERLIAAEDLAEAQRTSREALEEYGNEINSLFRALDAMPEIGDNAQAVKNVRQLVREFLSGQRSATDLHAELQAIAGTNVSGGMVALIGRIQAAIPLAASLKRIMNAASFGMAFGGPESDPQAAAQAYIDQVISDSKLTPDESEFNSLVDQYMGEGGLLREQAEETARSVMANRDAIDAASDSAGSATKSYEQFRDGMADLNRQVELSKMDEFWGEVVSTAEGLGIATDEIDAFIAAVQSGGLDAAPEKFRAIADSIREIKLNETLRDLRSDTESMFASSWDNSIIETLRTAGVEADSFYGRMIANQIRLNEGLELGRDLSKDVFGGIAQDLMNGVSWTEALNNAVGRLRDRLMDMAMELITNAAFGYIQQMLGPMIGGGSTFHAPTSFVPGGFYPGLPGYETGTADTGGQRGQVRGLVHGREAVIPLPNSGKVPVELRLLDLASAVTGMTRSLPKISTATDTRSLVPQVMFELVNEGPPMQSRDGGTRNEGGMDIKRVILSPVQQAFAEGAMDGIMSRLYGLRRQGAS